MLTVLLTLDHARIAGEEAASLQRRAGGRVEEGQGTADAVAQGAGLARQTTTGNGGDDVELALDAGVDNSYMARVLRLTLLAPDIIESILNGTEPDGLSLQKLYEAPVIWEEQCRALRLYE